MKLRSVTAGMLATAMLATSAAPAAAQVYGGRGYGYNNGYNGSGYGNDRYRRHDRDRGPSAGEVIGAVAVVGIIAAIAASAAKSNRDRRAQQNGYQNGSGDERTASDACASAAEQRAGRDARVTAIDAVDRFNDGYRVRGTIETRDYSSSRDRTSFTCTVRYGEVERVDLGGYAYNR